MLNETFSVIFKHREHVFLGFNDNGSGMAALLEIARALGQSQCKYVSGSILLAALDLEEVGTHGASAFLHEFLVEKILRPFHFPVVKVIDDLIIITFSPSSFFFNTFSAAVLLGLHHHDILDSAGSHCARFDNDIQYNQRLTRHLRALSQVVSYAQPTNSTTRRKRRFHGGFF